MTDKKFKILVKRAFKAFIDNEKFKPVLVKGGCAGKKYEDREITIYFKKVKGK